MKNSKIIGHIDSIETMGLVDGPGIRVVVFMQGCPLRCIYCHNPETWHINDNYTITPDDLVKIILKYKNYFGNSGGVTFSGGEPLMQRDFLLETLKLCKKENINTCIDTAGSCEGYEELLRYVDLVIMDIKAIDSSDYEKITKFKITNSLTFLNYCQKMNKKLWLRQVIVPGINDNVDNVKKLARFIKPLKNIERIELLPYHTSAITKYKKLNIPYELANTKGMDIEKCHELENLLKEELWKKI
mgnify:CR=1 FL=1